MAGREYPLVPREVPHVNTRYRRIVTPIPVPESIPILEELRTYEPRSMSGQPPLLCGFTGGKTIGGSHGPTAVRPTLIHVPIVRSNPTDR